MPTAARRHDVLTLLPEADGALPGEEWWSRQERAGGACAMQMSFLAAASGWLARRELLVRVGCETEDL